MRFVNIYYIANKHLDIYIYIYAYIIFARVIYIHRGIYI